MYIRSSPLASEESGSSHRNKQNIRATFQTHYQPTSLPTTSHKLKPTQTTCPPTQLTTTSPRPTRQLSSRSSAASQPSPRTPSTAPHPPLLSLPAARAPSKRSSPHCDQQRKSSHPLPSTPLASRHHTRPPRRMARSRLPPSTLRGRLPTHTATSPPSFLTAGAPTRSARSVQASGFRCGFD